MNYIVLMNNMLNVFLAILRTQKIFHKKILFVVHVGMLYVNHITLFFQA